ncbi:MAG TPA: membrane protein insertase YidC [Desulfobulbus sp.]|nr:membrane protein insertase YidC [Desulfobulbus sp.]
MDLHRALLAFVLSIAILLGYQYFFVRPVVQQQPRQPAPAGDTARQDPSAPGKAPAAAPAAPAEAAPAATSMVQQVAVNPAARDITIDTPLYKAVINEQGGGFKSFVLKKYRQKLDRNSDPMQLVQTHNPVELPLLFTLDNGAASRLPLYRADATSLTLKGSGDTATLVMTASLDSGLKITRTLTFNGADYMVKNSYRVENTGSAPVPITPAMVLTNEPFEQNAASGGVSRYLFSGPAAYIDQKLNQVKGKALKEGPKVMQGNVTWAAYEDNYFICAVIPQPPGLRTVTIRARDERVRTVVADGPVSLAPQTAREFQFNAYFGPKKLAILKAVDHELAKAVNFGWFDVIAKPMLWLLNFFYSFVHNYGVAIIMVTILIKAAFWHITSKGMKSMKNMQKLQPKVAKLKEKYKDDPTRMNQEMMALYKTYKVNPVGGCLPMLIQIPFFFALYRVLMSAIELRHAPFMLWINDLSAPDRLMIGFDIPYIHGIPVLTLLMGASMYLQQKMTPTTADPTQAKIMQFLPILFTFMFLNFASGLVLYWLVNNLLSILQQQLINRQVKATSQAS